MTDDSAGNLWTIIERYTLENNNKKVRQENLPNFKYRGLTGLFSLCFLWIIRSFYL